MLVLLIIFMVIIPNMQDGKPIEMVNVFNPDPDAEDKDEPSTITIDRSEVYTVDKQDLTRTQVLAQLQAVYERSPKRKLLIRGDARLRYAEVRGFFHGSKTSASAASPSPSAPSASGTATRRSE